MEFSELVKQRRSVNFFDPDKDVSPELLKQAVELAANSPSSFNLQPWSIIEIRDASKKEKLRKLAWDQPKITDAPVVLIFLADMEGWNASSHVFEKNFEEFKKAGIMKEEQREWLAGSCRNLYGISDARSLAFACKNTGFFTGIFMLAAKSLGLDTHPMDGFDLDGVIKEFKIPENYWVPLIMSVGYFKEGSPMPPYKWRKKYEDIMVRF
ncbi:nitroreductase family protein [Desulforegula conservatrix]|uniref:nitroreductase family protein n=1 Tax=Desulforegula conservatrix TaxID=153026 RepID=UPI00040513C4|nr:nitroreductase family protein [Desulforegula conservatrix]